MHISKDGDPYLRTLLVQGAHHILGRFGADGDLRSWGLKLAERGGKNGKKRAIIATARKLAVLLHRLWVSPIEGDVKRYFSPSAGRGRTSRTSSPPRGLPLRLERFFAAERQAELLPFRRFHDTIRCRRHSTPETCKQSG